MGVPSYNFGREGALAGLVRSPVSSKGLPAALHEACAGPRHRRALVGRRQAGGRGVLWMVYDQFRWVSSGGLGRLWQSRSCFPGESLPVFPMLRPKMAKTQLHKNIM